MVSNKVRRKFSKPLHCNMIFQELKTRNRVIPNLAVHLLNSHLTNERPLNAVPSPVRIQVSLLTFPANIRLYHIPLISQLPPTSLGRKVTPFPVN